MTKVSVRRAVFNEMKHHTHKGITVSDLSVMTNFEIKEVNAALRYFRRNAIVDYKETPDGVVWYATN